MCDDINCENFDEKDAYGPTPEEAAAEAEQKKRDENPAYSLEKHKDEYRQVLRELYKHVQDGIDGVIVPIEFGQELSYLNTKIDHLLNAIEFDIARVGEESNPGWVKAQYGVGRRRGTQYVPYSRIGHGPRGYLGGRN